MRGIRIHELLDESDLALTNVPFKVLVSRSPLGIKSFLMHFL
jgi:hypothetical protein